MKSAAAAAACVGELRNCRCPACTYIG
jgi:hypothetical protein